MAWVMDTYSMHVRQATTAVVTGKPLDLGGSQGRKEATGRGVDDLLRKAIAKLGMKREGCRVIIQGFGNVGSQAALLMHEAGYKIIGVADIHGGLYNEKGFDIPQAVRLGLHAAQTACPNFRAAATKMSAQEILFHPCDILIPAATENQITSAERASRGCRILCEGANGPTTVRTPIRSSRQRDIFIIPDILATPAA